MSDTATPDSLDHTITRWTQWLSVRYAQTTVRSYTWELRQFNAYLNDALNATEITLDHLTAYIESRRKRAVGDEAIHRTASAFRNFFRFACGDQSPAQKLPWPRIKRHKQRSLNAAEMSQLLAACDPQTNVGTRDLALLSLFLDTGLRASEICRLKLKETDVKRRRLTVVIKGGNESERAFSQETAERIRAWLEVRREYALPGTLTVFTSIGGLTPGQALTVGGLHRIFAYLAQRAKWERGLSPHELRRAFARISTQAGAQCNSAAGGKTSKK